MLSRGPFSDLNNELNTGITCEVAAAASLCTARWGDLIASFRAAIVRQLMAVAPRMKRPSHYSWTGAVRRILRVMVPTLHDPIEAHKRPKKRVEEWKINGTKTMVETVASAVVEVGFFLLFYVRTTRQGDRFKKNACCQIAGF